MFCKGTLQCSFYSFPQARAEKAEEIVREMTLGHFQPALFFLLIIFVWVRESGKEVGIFGQSRPWERGKSSLCMAPSPSFSHPTASAWSKAESENPLATCISFMKLRASHYGRTVMKVYSGRRRLGLQPLPHTTGLINEGHALP